MLNGQTLLAPAAPTHTAYVSGNQLLDALPPRDRADLEGDIEIVTLAAHNSTQSAGRVMNYVDFPIDAVLSVVATLETGDTLEVGTVGNEGFVESDAVLESGHSQRTSFCQVRGTVGRMSIDQFAFRMATSDAFARMMRRNVRATLFTTQQFVACNAKHSILQRCARCLSMTAERVGSPHFTLTHKRLATTLGVRRASVSEAADMLKTMGAITYRRSVVTVLDTDLLNGAACECFAACKLAFAASLSDDTAHPAFFD